MLSVLGALRGEAHRLRGVVREERACNISPSSASEPWAMLANACYRIAVYAMIPYHLFVSRVSTAR